MHQFEVFIPVSPELSDVMRENRMTNECLRESQFGLPLTLFISIFFSD